MDVRLALFCRAVGSHGMVFTDVTTYKSNRFPAVIKDLRFVPSSLPPLIDRTFVWNLFAGKYLISLYMGLQGSLPCLFVLERTFGTHNNSAGEMPCYTPPRV